jgi:inorganic pyrophosphatase
MVRAVTEIGRNSTNKYEYDPEAGLFRLDRVLYAPMHFPGDYGFIPGTIAEDGEPLDVLTLVQEPSFPGCISWIRPVGMLDLVEESEIDHKVLAVGSRHPVYGSIQHLGDVSPHVLTEVQHFFEIYKELEGSGARAKGWRDRTEAQDTIREARERWLAKRTQHRQDAQATPVPAPETAAN